MGSTGTWTAATDEALLSALAAGDSEAATVFVRRFQSRVYGLVYTIVGDRGRAEDVAQEAFVKAWKHAGSYDPRRGRVATWLLTIARNVAIDVTRLKRVEPLDPDVVAGRLQSIGETAPAVDHDMPPDERERIRAAINDLPHEQRRPLFLATYLGRTANEISKMDDLPLGTVKSRIRTAMLKLHDSLEAANEV